MDDPANNSFNAHFLHEIKVEIASHKWEEDSSLLSNFFPVTTDIRKKFLAIKKRNYDHRARRWKSLSETPIDPSELFKPLRELLNDILKPPGELRPRGDPRRRDHQRYIFETHKKPVFTATDMTLSPALYFAGSGTEFPRSTCETPDPNSLNGISPIEVVLEEMVNSSRVRLAAHMWHIFHRQPNRRFAFGLILTERKCHVFLFDPVGISSAQPFSHHQNPEQLCAVIHGLGSDKVSDYGFDFNYFRLPGGLGVRTWERSTQSSPIEMEVRYKITKVIYRGPELFGQKTFCWLVEIVGEPGTRYVIKDAWTMSELTGKESEGSLLTHIQSCDVSLGVAQLRHYEQVRRSEKRSDIDTTSRNRRMSRPDRQARMQERVHTRIVLKAYGEPLHHFQNRKELILAFHDAVLAHRNIYQKAGILHRDISPRNILINPNGEEGNRGVLIDFEYAIRISNTSQYARDVVVGTRRFMSRKRLRKAALDVQGRYKNLLHTYLDDFESFYYVLIWITCAYTYPSMCQEPLPRDLSEWDQEAPWLFKQRHFSVDEMDIKVNPYFGESIYNLLKDLWRFFASRRNIFALALSDLNPDKDYDEFMAPIQRCVQRLLDE